MLEWVRGAAVRGGKLRKQTEELHKARWHCHNFAVWVRWVYLSGNFLATNVGKRWNIHETSLRIHQKQHFWALHAICTSAAVPWPNGMSGLQILFSCFAANIVLYGMFCKVRYHWRNTSRNFVPGVPMDLQLLRCWSVCPAMNHRYVRCPSRLCFFGKFTPISLTCLGSPQSIYDILWPPSSWNAIVYKGCGMARNMFLILGCGH